MTIITADMDGEIGGISTGLPQLDRLTGVGGIPIGRVSIITGNYSVGKSTLALSVVREAQKEGYKCLWADSEISFTKEYAELIGVNNKKLDLLRASHAEAFLDAIEEYVTKNSKCLVVLDSYSGLSDRQETEKTNEGFTIATKARLVAKFLRKIKTPLFFNESALIIVNHEYANISGHGTILAGGDTMQKVPSLWIKLTRPGSQNMIKQGDTFIGERVIARLQKVKVGGNRFGECELQYYYGRGFDAKSDDWQKALDEGIIMKKGNTYFMGETKLGIGLEKAKQAFSELSTVSAGNSHEESVI